MECWQVYAMARRQQASYVQCFIPCSLEHAITRNAQRPAARRVLLLVLDRMAQVHVAQGLRLIDSSADCAASCAPMGTHKQSGHRTPHLLLIIAYGYPNPGAIL